ncbi:MAG: glycosyltransferase family 39 protein [Ardenticatenales bacterium]|nr:glycosyltransferase family 39 protein [Ardenticatenales bacterium]
MSTHRAEPAPSSRQNIILISTIILLAILLRLLYLGRWSLWIDEYHTLRMAREARLLVEGIPGDQHPPLYYLFMTLWIRFGVSEFWLRLPSAVSGIVAVVMMWRIGAALNRPRLGLLAALLLATIPLHIWYSREARMYGLISGFWVSSLYFYIQTIRRDSWLDTLGLALANTIALGLAYPTLALLVLELSFFLLGWSLAGKRPLRVMRFILAQLPPIAGAIFWWPYFQIQLGRGGVFNWALPGLDFQPTLGQTVAGAGLIGLGLLAVVVLASWLLARQPRLLGWIATRANWWAVAILLGFLPLLLIGVIPRGLSVRRQLLVFLPILILLAGWALDQLRRRWLTGIYLGLATLLGLSMLWLPPYENWGGAVDFIEAHETAGDAIFLLRPWYEPYAMDYYYEGVIPFEDRHTIAGELETVLAEYPAGSTVWVMANATPAEEALMTKLWQPFAAVGDQVAEAEFPTYLIVRGYRLR